jgi:hypothetical protein
VPRWGAARVTRLGHALIPSERETRNNLGAPKGSSDLVAAKRGSPYGTATAVTTNVIVPSGSTIVPVHWISVPCRPVR